MQENKEGQEGLVELIKNVRRVAKLASRRLIDVLPLIRQLDALGKRLSRELVQLRSNRCALPEASNSSVRRVELFRKVAIVLDSADMKKRTLISRLNESGVNVPTAFQIYLKAWRDQGLFDTSLGIGWYKLSGKGRATAGLAARQPGQRSSFVSSNDQMTAEVENVQLKAQLLKAREEIRKLRQVAQVEKPVAVGIRRGKKPRVQSQFEVLILGLAEAGRKGLNRKEIASLLDRFGKKYTSQSLTVLLTPTGCRGTVAFSGDRGSRQYFLTEAGIAKARNLMGVQSPQQDLAPCFPPPPPPSPSKVNPYSLKKEQLTDGHLDRLSVAMGRVDSLPQRFFKVTDDRGKHSWVWWGWGLVGGEQCLIPEQPLLGYMLEHGEMPKEYLDLPKTRCVIEFERHAVDFDPAVKVSGRIIEFVMRNGKLPSRH